MKKQNEDNRPNNFLFHMFLAKHRTGFLVWDNEWHEWDFIETFAWEALSDEIKQDLEIIKYFNNEKRSTI